MRSLLLLEEAVGATGLPAAVQPSGYAFVELAVAPQAASGLERLLIALGFRQAGHHRTKAVQLWRRGRPMSWSTTSARARTARGGDRGRERRPDPLGRARRAAARPAAAARARAGRGGPVGHRGARRHVRVLLPHRRHGRRGLARRLRARRPARAGRDGRGLRESTTSRSPAVRLLRRGRALLARCWVARSTRASSSPPRRASCAAARPAAPTAASASRSTCRWSAAAARRSSSTSRSPAATSPPPRAPCATAACRCSPCAGQLLRRPGGAHRPRAGDDRPPARARRPVRRGGRR